MCIFLACYEECHQLVVFTAFTTEARPSRTLTVSSIGLITILYNNNNNNNQNTFITFISSFIIYFYYLFLFSSLIWTIGLIQINDWLIDWLIRRAEMSGKAAEPALSTIQQCPCTAIVKKSFKNSCIRIVVRVATENCYYPHHLSPIEKFHRNSSTIFELSCPQTNAQRQNIIFSSDDIIIFIITVYKRL